MERSRAVEELLPDRAGDSREAPVLTVSRDQAIS